MKHAARPASRNRNNRQTTTKKGTAMKAEPNKRNVTRARTTVSLVAITALMAATLPAQTAIQNTATANGTPARGSFTAPTDTETVPVATGAPAVNIVKTVASVTDGNGNDTGAIDGADDIIVYRYEVENTGNVTLSSLTPVDSGPLFNGVAGENGLVGFTHDTGDGANTATDLGAVAPGEIAVFTATYTVTEGDYLRGAQVDNGVDNSATATSAETPTTNTSTVETNITASPSLQIVKTANLVKGSGNSAVGAEVGDTIDYTYTVTNDGNVAMTGITISDVHEPLEAHQIVLASDAGWNESLTSDGPLAPGTASSDASTDGSWDLLQPGAVITFTYTHTVSQAEFDAQ